MVNDLPSPMRPSLSALQKAREFVWSASRCDSACLHVHCDESDLVETVSDLLAGEHFATWVDPILRALDLPASWVEYGEWSALRSDDVVKRIEESKDA